MIYEKLGKCVSWALHVTEVWYIRPQMQGYQCYQVYITNTRTERILYTVYFTHNAQRCHTFRWQIKYINLLLMLGIF